MTNKVVMWESWGPPGSVHSPREVTVEDMEWQIKQIEDAIPTMSAERQEEARKYVQYWKETLKKMQ